jgi:carboxypeptidase C (cathepsin A)
MKSLMSLASTLAIVSAIVMSAAPAHAGAEPAPRIARTEHSTSINDERVAYVATVQEHLVKNPAGTPTAYVTTIAYVRSDTRDASRRPVMFAFNGGPGASSSPLHMQALGPVLRVDRRGGNRATRPNPYSVLDTADLVFIDPVSTGFSRALPGADAQPFFDTRFDAITIGDVIARWLKENEREASPRFLAGESYGTTRAGLIVKYAPQVRFDGVLLISGSDDSGLDQVARTLVYVPSAAAGAWYHRVVDRRGLTVEQFYREASDFARGELAEGLRNDLSPERKRQLAEKLSRYIGLSPELILEKNFAIDRNTYMFNLLKDRGLRTGGLDIRVTSALTPNQEGSIDDPALGVLKPGTVAGRTPTVADAGAFESPAVGNYIRTQLKYPGNEPYYGVNFISNSKWTFHEDDPSTEAIMASAMQADPRLRLFTTSGYFDFGASDQTGALAAGVPQNRLTFLPLPGPHEVYDGDDNLKLFNQALRAFVTGTAK